MKVKIRIDNLTKLYADPRTSEIVHALDRIRLDIYEGEFLSLIGPSGCGKSTLLYIIAGFESPSEGNVFLDSEKIKNPGPDRGLVFQEYALFPWMTARKNVEFGLKMKGISEKERLEISQEYLNIMGLKGFENKFPHELSGGMRQRCALARCMATHPEVLLMDEPLASVDAMTRTMLQEEILKVWGEGKAEERKTAIYVTHSIDEAIFLSDRIVAMSSRPGKITQIIDVPFSRPRSEDTRLDPNFSKLSTEIWHMFKESLNSF
jgi:NitT/TauT family transport system ATP-binding protein